MIKAIKMLAEKVEINGYKTVVQETGISRSYLFDLTTGRRPADGITLKKAVKLYEVYGIEYDDWFVEG